MWKRERRLIAAKLHTFNAVWMLVTRPIDPSVLRFGVVRTPRFLVSEAHGGRPGGSQIPPDISQTLMCPHTYSSIRRNKFTILDPTGTHALQAVSFPRLATGYARKHSTSIDGFRHWNAHGHHTRRTCFAKIKQSVLLPACLRQGQNWKQARAV